MGNVLAGKWTETRGAHILEIVADVAKKVNARKNVMIDLATPTIPLFALDMENADARTKRMVKHAR